MSDMAEMELAQQCSDRLHKHDYMAQSSGMEPESLSPGESRVIMTVTKDMLNGLGSCHGGMIFSLADTAFAHACNNRNKANVAMDCRIDFLYPGYEGDELTAIARETHKGRKSSLYEIKVTNQENRNIAFFQGRSYYISKPVIEE